MWVCGYAAFKEGELCLLSLFQAASKRVKTERGNHARQSRFGR